MATPETADLGPGSQLGRYRIEKPISAGAMGAVYRAHNVVSQTDVAIKRLLDTSHAARFEIEARLLSGLEHPRVVRVLDHFQDSTGVYYIVMELIEGPDLGQVLKDRGDPGMPIHDVLEWARQACEALQYVHEQQIVHRDVKPQNLIESADGVVLVDFGVATQLNTTDTGTAGIGTPRFMAPEVFAGGAVSPRADVFSLAATVWNLIIGEAPVYADDRKLADTIPGVTPELEETLRAGLEIIPERRVASAEAFARALGSPLLEKTGASLGLSLEQPGAPRKPDGGCRPHRRRRVRGRRRFGGAARPHDRGARLPRGVGGGREGDRGRAAAARRGHQRRRGGVGRRPGRAGVPQ